MDRLKMAELFRKYRFVLAVLAVGIALMLLPSAPAAQEEAPAPTETQTQDMETRLKRILGRIDGAGEVDVMLTEAAGSRSFTRPMGRKRIRSWSPTLSAMSRGWCGPGSRQPIGAPSCCAAGRTARRCVWPSWTRCPRSPVLAAIRSLC